MSHAVARAVCEASPALTCLRHSFPLVLKLTLGNEGKMVFLSRSSADSSSATSFQLVRGHPSQFQRAGFSRASRLVFRQLHSSWLHRPHSPSAAAIRSNRSWTQPVA